MDIRYFTLPNATETAEKAPYTGRIVPNGVANLNDLVGILEGRIAVSGDRARIILNAAIEAAIGRCRCGETVKFGGITLKPRIENSFSYVDEPFDPATNRVIIECYLGDELQGVLDRVVPARVSAEDMASKVKFSNVMDDGTQVFNVINGTESFSVLGNSITVDGEGESVKLVDPKTGAALLTAEIDTVARGQRAKCHFPASNVASGKYKVVLTTFGLAGDATAHVLPKNVVYTAGEAPVVEPTVSSMSGVFTGDDIVGKVVITVDGSNLGPIESGDEVKIECADYDDVVMGGSQLQANDDGTQLIATANGLAGPDYGDKEITVTLTKIKDGESYALTKTFMCARGE